MFLIAFVSAVQYPAEHCGIGSNRQPQYTTTVIVNPGLLRRVRTA
jgi:hypothetical protein